MKRAIGYCRVSSEKQVDNYSLDTQEQGIKTWCRRNDLDLVRIFPEEGKSARAWTAKNYRSSAVTAGARGSTWW